MLLQGWDSWRCSYPNSIATMPSNPRAEKPLRSLNYGHLRADVAEMNVMACSR